MEFFSKKKHLTKALEDYTSEIDRTMAVFSETMQAFFKGKDEDTLDDLCGKVRKQESKCDRHRREIEKQMFAGALMPSARGDIFALMEALDKVPNKAEDVANFVAQVMPDVPEDLHGDIQEILKLTNKCISVLLAAVSQLFKNLQKASEDAQQVDEIESDIDKLERRLIRNIFRNKELAYGHRMMLRELVVSLCAISDRAENASDRIEIAAIKRKT